jgi:mutator protein MutT
MRYRLRQIPTRMRVGRQWLTSPVKCPLMKQLQAAIAIITRDKKILICQRRAGDRFGGYWEFPGGKLEPGETLHDCLARELMEEVGLTARPIRPLTVIEHHYPHAHIRLHPFHCQHESGEVQKLECQDARWVNPEMLTDYRFPPANEGLIAEVIEYLQRIDRESARE